jgi:hypothetical protein
LTPYWSTAFVRPFSRLTPTKHVKSREEVQ